MAGRDDYALASSAALEMPAPVLPYAPPRPRKRHPIALVGAGGISFAHLDAYRSYGFDVVAILSRDVAKARDRAREFFPRADVMTDYAALLARPDIEIVDLTPHPEDRYPLMEQALRAGKHVLSQKPFVTDLDAGERLVALARARGVKLAVNQNGRWAPHLAWMRAAVAAGLVGEVMAVHCAVHWDHRWIRGTAFEQVPDVVLFDFAVHWFDFVTSIAGRLADRVQAQALHPPFAQMAAPMLGAALMDFGTAQASLVFDAATPYGPQDTTYVAGSAGSLIARGPDLGNQTVELHTAKGVARPELRGGWFNDGFAGTMGALMVAIEQDAEPENGAEGNLLSLANCFAALKAAQSGQAEIPGAVRVRP